MTEPGIHELMGPNDDYEAKPAPAVGPTEPAFPDLTDPAVRRRLRAEIDRVEGSQPSPHVLRGTKHDASLRTAARNLQDAQDAITQVMADPQVRGIPRDQLQLVAVELNRNIPRLERALDG